MIKVLHLDEETTLKTTHALCAILKPEDPLLQQWIRACRVFGYNVYQQQGIWVFSRPV